MPVRRVLITGASKGIGCAVADRVARAGNVAIGLARTAPPDFPGEFVAVDLSDVAATAAALDAVIAGGRVDAVVNNFGYSDAFDVIIAFDAVHDQVQPARVLAMSRCAKAPDEFGSLLLQLHAIRG
jgi:NAD(P)-dependent dehydrogenase (short-subunit alcohol dehydrogenase family)